MRLQGTPQRPRLAFTLLIAAMAALAGTVFFLNVKTVPGETPNIGETKSTPPLDTPPSDIAMQKTTGNGDQASGRVIPPRTGMPSEGVGGASDTSSQAVFEDTVQDRYFQTSDGIRLHYFLGGVQVPSARTLVFITGWAMPAEIWWWQMRYFAPRFRVVALDPRSQGRSDIAEEGHTPARRAQDIAELLKELGGRPVVLVGWSLGVLEALSYVKDHGNAGLEALVLVDNSVGEEPPPEPTEFMRRYRKERESGMRWFVREMFRTPQPEGFLEDLTRSALRIPMKQSLDLLNTLYPREVWRKALYSVQVPLLYVVTSRFSEQSENLNRKRPETWTEVFPNAGHALFVDEEERFNLLLQRFLMAMEPTR